MKERGQYSLENAKTFGWSSITGNLHPERIEHLRRHLVGNSALDAGCGGGAYVEYLAANGWKATGLERSEEFLAVAQSNGTRGEYVLGDVADTPFEDGQFDSVYCFDVIEHVENDSRAVRELCRIAKNRVILAVPANDENVVGHGLTYGHYQDLTHLRTYTRASLEDLIRGAGQSVFSIHPELPVDLQGLAINHLIDPTLTDSKAAAVSIWTFVKRRVLNLFLNRLLSRAKYRRLYSGWVAIIDIGQATRY